MDWFINSQDLLMVITIPLMFVTFFGMVKNWDSIWDKNVTSEDRRMLMRIAMFLLMPIVVFCHELGHAVTILYYGGQIATFHFGILWGYVVPRGDFTDFQKLMIFLAGNAVEVALGFVALFAGALCTSPPVVAVLVYLGIWAIAGTVVVYALMSLTGYYGDWIFIYTSPVESAVNIIRICHCALVAFVVYACYGKAPRLWFAIKTRPTFAVEYKLLQEKVKEKPTPRGYEDIAWLLYETGLNEQADEYLNRSLKIDANAPEPLLLKGWLLADRDRFQKAEESFQEVAKHSRSSPLLRARALMAFAWCKLARAGKANSSKEESNKLIEQAIEAYGAASLADPDLADPRFHRAVLLNKLGDHAQAEFELLSLERLNWLDSGLQKRIPTELQKAREANVAKT